MKNKVVYLLAVQLTLVLLLTGCSNNSNGMSYSELELELETAKERIAELEEIASEKSDLEDRYADLSYVASSMADVLNACSEFYQFKKDYFLTEADIEEIVNDSLSEYNEFLKNK